jgi:1-propanol dehydrogenase
MKSFDIKTKIYFGENALDRVAEIPYKRVMVITDPFVVQSGMIKLITYRLEEGRTEYEVFSDVVPDPPIDKIVVGVKALLEYNPEAVIAVGGGSAIDSAKSIKKFAIDIGNLFGHPINSNSYNKWNWFRSYVLCGYFRSRESSQISACIRRDDTS